GVVPKRLSFDDGYSSKGVRDDYLKKHGDRVEIFSFAGSKGRQAIGGNEYDREDYRKARSDRSAAESRIFTLKFNHGYGEISRRGLEEVRHEQLTKVLAFNLRKIVWLRAAKNDRRSKGKAGKQRMAA
ncbi:MAG: transposase, partial [Verrucomicrobiota bacterium]